MDPIITNTKSCCRSESHFLTCDRINISAEAGSVFLLIWNRISSSPVHFQWANYTAFCRNYLFPGKYPGDFYSIAGGYRHILKSAAKFGRIKNCQGHSLVVIIWHEVRWTLELLHPADQLVMLMERIYQYGMTTTSGGNLSILDENGDIWITPGSVDKGSLSRKDIIQVETWRYNYRDP